MQELEMFSQSVEVFNGLQCVRFRTEVKSGDVVLVAPPGLEHYTEFGTKLGARSFEMRVLRSTPVDEHYDAMFAGLPVIEKCSRFYL